MRRFIGETGKSLLDRWSVVHFAAGLIVGADLQSQGVRLVPWVLICLVLAYAWEGIEILIEKYKPTWVKHPEGALNRWVSDPIMLILGSFFGHLLIRGQ